MIVDLTADSQAWDFSTTERDNDVPSAASTSAVVSSKPQANSKMRQRNLFGALVNSPPNQGTSKPRKRKDPPEESSSTASRAAAPPLPPLVVQQQVKSDEPFPRLWKKANKNMKEIFGIKVMRGLQPAAIEGTLRCQSQIVVMATGGGKSLCYQLPATVLGGVTLVVSPLIALMVDQVRALNDKGVAAALVSSANGAVRTETLWTVSWVDLKKKNKTMAHNAQSRCCMERRNWYKQIASETFSWNYINRIDWRCLPLMKHTVFRRGDTTFGQPTASFQWLRTSFPDIPCTVCTATATSKVIPDIRDTLLLKDGEVPCHMGSFNRPNISYEVRYKESLDARDFTGAMDDLVELVKQQHTRLSEGPFLAVGLYTFTRDMIAICWRNRLARQLAFVLLLITVVSKMPIELMCSVSGRMARLMLL